MEEKLISLEPEIGLQGNALVVVVVIVVVVVVVTNKY